ncbi:calcium-binding protein [Selenomonas sp. AB3002]|uniref:calcium-binding protein n=1 Tax=Selenomonas sp. AB3002 TaxID=1392502 RepID=UPI0004953050
MDSREPASDPDSYGLTFNESGTTVNTISSINFVNLADDTLALVNHQYHTDDGKATALSLTINMRYYANLGADVNGTAKNTHLDRVIAHEMTHAAMAANIDFFHTMPISVKEGAAELVHGIDDERTLAIKQLARNADNLKTVLSSDSNYGEHSYAGGYMLLRYLAHQLSGGSAAPASTSAPEPASTPTDTTETKPNVTKLTAKSPGSFWLSGYDPLTGEKDTAYPNCKELDGSEVTGEVILGGNGQDNLIKGGKGSSSLWGGGASNDTLQGGSGRDMIWYGAGDGHDVASNFTPGTGGSSDVLNFYSGSLSGITRSGNTLHLSMADGGSLTVNTTAGSDSAVLYSTDAAAHLYGAKIGESAKANNLSYRNDLAFFQGGSGRDTLTASGSDSKSIWLDGSQGQSFVSIELLDGSKSSGSDQLAGGWGEETIAGGSGSASLWGGAGSASDTLRSGSGSNVLFYGYGEGNDVMQNTSSGDRVMLYNMGLEHLTGAQVSKDIISITTTAGHTLTVSGQAGVFTLRDGSSWKPDRQQGSWSAV